MRTPNGRPPALLAATFFGGRPLSYVPTLMMGADMTVALGPNAAGKSTALNALASGLLAPSDDPRGVSGSRDMNADLKLLFLNLDRRHLDALLADTIARIERGQGIVPIELTGFHNDGWEIDDSYRPPPGWQDRAATEAWLTMLRASVWAGSSAPERELVLRAVSESTVIAVETVHHEGQVLAYWCLEHGADPMEPGLAETLSALGLREGPLDIPVDSWSPEAPLPVAPIGLIPSEVIPRIVGAPEGDDLGAGELRRSMAMLITSLRHGAEVARAQVFEPSPLGGDLADAAIWLDEFPDGSVAICADAWMAVQLAEYFINRFLPPFIASALRVTISVQRISAWHGGPLLSLHGAELTEDPETPASELEEFPLQRAAAGYKLWLELAILEASAALFAAIPHLKPSDADAEAGAEADSKADDQGVPDTNGAEEQPETVSENDPAAIEDLAGILEELDKHPRVYVIDEPERHLHASLERRAARWLNEFARRPGRQVVVATHSPRFLRLTGDVVWNFIEPRAGDRDYPGEARPSRIATFRPHELDALGSLATIMGFDRGELLAGVELILFVEGDSDRDVLTELWGPELHAAGIAIFPYHGVRDAKQKGLTDAEVLVRYTAADLAILVDNAVKDDVRRLKEDDAFRDEMRRTKSRSKQELKALAQVFHAAVRSDRPLSPIGIDAHDIFDLLDERAIHDRFPRFNSHAEASAAAQASDAHWKHTYALRFGLALVNDSWIFRAVAADMRRSGRPHDPRLLTLLDDILAAANHGRM